MVSATREAATPQGAEWFRQRWPVQQATVLVERDGRLLVSRLAAERRLEPSVEDVEE